MSELSDLKARYGDPTTFLNKVKTQLALHNIAQARLAIAAKVCPTQMSRWFTGRVDPTLESMMRIDEALTELLYGQSDS